MKIWLSLAVLLSATPAWATTFYVRECANNGTGATSTCAASPGGAGAWNTFANISWGSVTAGDTVYLVSGSTFSGPLNVGASGTAGSRLTIAVSGGGTVTIDCAGTVGCLGVNFSGRSYVTLDGVIGVKQSGETTYGLRVIGLASNASTNGYCVYENNGGHHGIVKHVECVGATTASPNDAGGGMYISSAGTDKGGWEIAYNWVHSTTSPTQWHASGIVLWASMGSTSYTGNLVHHNWVEDVYHDGIKVGSNTSVYNNVVVNVDGSGHSDSLLIQSGGYSAIYSNLVQGSGDQNIYVNNLYDSTCAHIRIYNNVINSNPGFGVVLDPEGGAGAGTAASTCTGSTTTLDDVVIANNTFVATSASMIRKGRANAITNVAILNNIFGAGVTGGYTVTDLHNSTSLSLASDTAWDYNVYAYSSGTAISNFGGSNRTLAQLQALSPARETNGALGAPTFVGGSDYRLSASDTVARTTGANLYSAYTFLQTDFYGYPRPSVGGWAMGAFADGSVAPATSIRKP